MWTPPPLRIERISTSFSSFSSFFSLSLLVHSSLEKEKEEGWGYEWRDALFSLHSSVCLFLFFFFSQRERRLGLSAELSLGVFLHAWTGESTEGILRRIFFLSSPWKLSTFSDDGDALQFLPSLCTWRLSQNHDWSSYGKRKSRNTHRKMKETLVKAMKSEI